MEAEKKTIIDPKYEPYKKPDNKDNQELGVLIKQLKYKCKQTKISQFQY